MDSLYRGYPVGYLITWRNPKVKLKDGSFAIGKRILIDGQQRVTALMAALLGREVLTKDYRTVRIRIAFHPKEEKFEVCNPAIEKDRAWMPDVAAVFDPSAKLLQMTRAFVAANPGSDEDEVFAALETLSKITNNHVGVIELAEDLDIEKVAEIFDRVNSTGTPLSQADFAMSKIAVNDKHGGPHLRKAIDYFCHLAVKPDFHGIVEKNDPAFAKTDYFKQMAWLRTENDEIYDPSYTDMLRVAFATEFRRGRLQDLVALLSGRDFETKQYTEAIMEDSFKRLRSGCLALHERDALQAFRDDHPVGGLRRCVDDRIAKRSQRGLHPLSPSAQPEDASQRNRALCAALVRNGNPDRTLLRISGIHNRLRHPANRCAGDQGLLGSADRGSALRRLLERGATTGNGYVGCV